MVRPSISLMLRKGKYIPIKKRKQIFCAFVQSHIIYVLPLYSEGLITKTDELQRIQNQSFKATYRLSRDNPTEYLCSSSMLPIEELAIVERVSHVHKMVKSLTKHNFILRRSREVHGILTRRMDNRHISRQHKNRINEYNVIGNELRHLTRIILYDRFQI